MEQDQYQNESNSTSTNVLHRTRKSIFGRWWFWALMGVVVLLISVFLIFLRSASQGKEEPLSVNSSSGSSNQTSNQKIYWRQSRDGWEAVGTPPACPEPLVLSIGDISRATSVLYPGQMRSVGYEPTAGFRFDKTPNNATQIEAPLDGKIVSAARFISDGSIQYVFDVISDCGIMNRFDHLLEIPPKLQAVADKLPEPKESDSRSTGINPPVPISKGEVIATKIGMAENNNNFLSWTVFDFRQKNKVSENPSWAAEHSGIDQYAICPYIYMTAEDQIIAKNLPAADEKSGNKSDFCNGIWP